MSPIGAVNGASVRVGEGMYVFAEHATAHPCSAHGPERAAVYLFMPRATPRDQTGTPVSNWRVTRWGRYFSPMSTRTFLSGSKLGLDHLPGAHVDLELCDLRAERGPGERRVHVDDVAARPVRDRLQEIAA